MSHEFRAEAVTRYDELKKELDKVRAHPASYEDGNERLKRLELELDRLYQEYANRTKDPLILLKDAEALEYITELTKKQYERPAPGERIELTPQLLAARVKQRIDHSFEGRATDWVRRFGAFGHQALNAVSGLPTVGHLLDVSEHVRAAPSGERARRVEGSAEHAEALEATDMDEQDETRLVRQMLRQVISIFRATSQPVPLYSLIASSEYSETVMNLFHFSFLARDNIVAILTKDNEPYVIPVMENEVAPEGYYYEATDNGSHQQMVVELSYPDFLAIKERYLSSGNGQRA